MRSEKDALRPSLPRQKLFSGSTLPMRFVIHGGPSLNRTLETKFITRYNPNPAPLKAVFAEVFDRGCKTVIEESDYVDTDFLSEYENFYARSFEKIPKYCKRLHFFSTEVKETDLIQLHEEQFKKAYIGFCVLRPIDVGKVGRTILSAPSSNHDFFLLCKAPFNSHIMGAEFEVQAMPFMQQDTSVGACAHACMWMTALYMHKKISLPKFLPFQLTEFAARAVSYGSMMPNRKGLEIHQVQEALRLAGMQCVTSEDFSKLKSDTIAEADSRAQKIKQFVYPYMESELPVILTHKYSSGVGHAVVVVGHNFSRNLNPRIFKTPSGIEYLSNVSWVPNFIVNNDGRGPYLTLPTDSMDPKEPSLKNLAFAIALLPPEVTNFAEDVESNVIEFMSMWDRNVSTKDLVFRTFMRASNRFLMDFNDRDIPQELKDKYRQMPMPKYIWITEISNKDYINQPDSKDRKVLGEFITDTTANPYGREKAFLSMRFLKNLVIHRKDDEGQMEPFLLSSSAQYTGLVRIN